MTTAVVCPPTAAVVCPPTVMHVPEYVSSAGQEAIELAEMAGLFLDDWQQLVLTHSLGERSDGKWAAFEVGLNVSRQNGKGGILEARELAGLYLIGESLITHSAHQFDTSLEAFRRLLLLVENTPELSRRVKRVSKSHGEEGIELHGRQRIRFRTRTAGGGRGFTGDCLILDEAMILRPSSHGALLPTLSARPNPQIWYTGSAVDQLEHEHGVVFARVRERGRARTDPRLAFFEWSADAGDSDEPLDPSHLPDELADDPEAWARANPALDLRITREFVAQERRSLDPRTFAVERLNIGDWPATDPDAGAVIPLARWRALEDPHSTIKGGLCFVFDVSEDRSWASIASGGRREDNNAHVELVDRRQGTAWLAERVSELVRKHQPGAVLYDGAGPGSAVADEIAARGVSLTPVATSDYVKACGVFYDAVEAGRLRHLGAKEMESAIRGCARRPLVDSWAWSRRASRVDISPLVAATIAVWRTFQPPAEPWGEAW